MRRLVLLFVLLHAIRCSCPDGFELVRDGECRGLYATMNLDTNAAPPTTAVSKCKEIQGDPVIIHNDERQSYWTGRSRRDPYLMLALVCNHDSKLWEWTDGSALDYKSPQGYQPQLDQECFDGFVWILFPDGGWGDGSGGFMQFDIFCTTELPPVSSEDGCEGFDDDSDDGVCYEVAATAETWLEAQQICRSFGADLASIHNLKENSFIRRLAFSKEAVSGMYLGATLAGKGNEFAWMDGSDWDYDNFYPGFPLSGLGDCLAMDTTGTTGEWVNVDCSSKQAVACERKQHYSPPDCSAGPWKEGDIIYSPGFPMSASTPCDFILSVDAGKKIRVEILLLEANSCCDRLIISENYIGGTVIANLTGEVNDKSYTTASSNYMRVSWQPNGGVNVRGVMFAFSAV